MTSPDIVRLTEYQRYELQLDEVDRAYMRTIDRNQIVMQELPGTKFVQLVCGSHVGVLMLPSGKRIEIAPKVPARNLLYMLSEAWDLAPELFEGDVELAEFADILEFLADHFADLVEARIVRGLYRTYVEETDNLTAIRGRIDFSEDLRLNAVLRHRTVCRYTTLTWDIPENQVIRQTLHLLAGWVQQPKRRQRLHELDRTLGEVRPVRLPLSVFDAFAYHRLNDDYEPIHRLCRLFLSCASMNEDQGIQPYRSFILNMNVLFEAYVAACLGRSLALPLSLKSQFSKKLDYENKVPIRPDLVIQSAGTPVLVADTKYKEIGDGIPGNSDIYQMLAYCIRLNTGVGILVYPGRTAHRFHIRETGIRLLTLGIDLDGTLDDLKRNSADLVRRILAHLPPGAMVPPVARPASLVAS